MKRIFAVLLIVCALCLIMASPIWAAWKMPPGSFLKYRAATVGDLTNQISTDPTVKMRYARHFKVSPDEITRSFNSDLQLIALKNPLRTTVWYIDKNGKAFKKSRVLPKGTMVFATKSGKPVLSWSCGNPLSTKLEAPKVEKVVTKPTPVDPVVTKVDPSVETITAATITAVPAVLTEAVAVEPVAAIPIIGSPSLSAVAPVISKGSSLGWIGALGGIIGGVAAAGGGGGSTTVVTPEPSSLIAMATGLSTLGILGRKRWSLLRK